MLTVCTDVPYPPMEYEDPDADSGFTGFDIELMREIALDLGLDLFVVTPGWDAITSGLAMDARHCDLSAAAITITPEREEGVDFSNPYFSADQSLLVEEDSNATEMADLGSVAVLSGTPGDLYVQDNAPDHVTIVSFESPGDLYLSLETGAVDGVVIDLVGNQGYLDDTGLGRIIEVYERYGLAFSEEGSDDLREEINAVLAKFVLDAPTPGSSTSSSRPTDRTLLLLLV